MSNLSETAKNSRIVLEIFKKKDWVRECNGYAKLGYGGINIYAYSSDVKQVYSPYEACTHSTLSTRYATWTPIQLVSAVSYLKGEKELSTCGIQRRTDCVDIIWDFGLKTLDIYLPMK